MKGPATACPSRRLELEHGRRGNGTGAGWAPGRGYAVTATHAIVALAQSAVRSLRSELGRSYAGYIAFARLLPSQVSKQALGEQPHDEKPQLRILVVQLKKHFVCHLVKLTLAVANQRLRTLFVRGEKTYFSEKLPCFHAMIDFFETNLAVCDVEQLVRRVAFAENDVTGAEPAPLHMRQQPLGHRRFVGRPLDLLRQLANFPDATHVDWQQDRVQKQAGPC